VFAEVAALATEHEGKQVIEQAVLEKYISRKHHSKTWGLGLATRVYKIVPVPWFKVTEGSIVELFRYYGDCEVDGKPAFTVDGLRDWYTDPAKYMRERQQKHSEE
jgi:hypothetical protein